MGGHLTKPTWNLDTREIGIRALRWLSETRDSTPDCPMGTRLSVLVGSWLCEVGLGVDPRARRSMASASLLRERLDRRAATRACRNGEGTLHQHPVRTVGIANGEGGEERSARSGPVGTRTFLRVTRGSPG